MSSAGKRSAKVTADEIRAAHPLAAARLVRYERIDSIWIESPFVPTHRACLYRPTYGRRGQPEQQEYVHLSAPQEGSCVAYGVVPAESDTPVIQEPRYAVDGRGRWQALWTALTVDAEPVELVSRRKPRTDDGQVPGHVYLIQAGGRGGPVKIGYSANVSRRIRELQTANAAPLKLLAVLPGTFADEHAFHARFARYRAQAEWFSPAPEVLEAFGVSSG